MSRYKIFILVFLPSLLIFTSCDRAESDEETEAIKQQAKSYERAFNQGDAKALSELWSEDGEYVNPESGIVVKGKDAIEKELQSSLKERENAQIEIKINAISFPKRNQAVETGIAVVTLNGEVLSQTAYKAIYEKKNGNWLIIQVREVESFDPPTQYEHLKELEWLIGNWVDQDEDVTIATICQWDKYKNFLTQQFTVTVEGKQEQEGRQVIAWDPANQKIRSWVFDSDGGFGTGTWKKKTTSWVVEASHTLADGRQASAVNIYTPINQNSYTWESVGREVGGELLPNIGPVTVVRKE